MLTYVLLLWRNCSSLLQKAFIKGLFGYKEVMSTSMTTILEEIKCGLQVTKATLKIIAVSTGESELTYDMREQEKYENLLAHIY